MNTRFCGAEDRTRTGRPCSGGGFSSHYGFHRQLFAVRALDFAFTMALPLQVPAVKSLHLPIVGLGSALPRIKSRGFADFDGIHACAFATRCSIYKSAVFTNFTTPARGRKIVAASSRFAPPLTAESAPNRQRRESGNRVLSFSGTRAADTGNVPRPPCASDTTWQDAWGLK